MVFIPETPLSLSHLSLVTDMLLYWGHSETVRKLYKIWLGTPPLKIFQKEKGNSSVTYINIMDARFYETRSMRYPQVCDRNGDKERIFQPYQSICIFSKQICIIYTTMYNGILSLLHISCNIQIWFCGNSFSGVPRLFKFLFYLHFCEDFFSKYAQISLQQKCIIISFLKNQILPEVTPGAFIWTIGQHKVKSLVVRAEKGLVGKWFLAFQSNGYKMQ